MKTKKHVVSVLYVTVMRVIALALVAVCLMGWFDRYYGSPVVAHAAEATDTAEQQTAIMEMMDKNHQNVNNIGRFLRTYISWNEKNPETYADEAYVVLDNAEDYVPLVENK